VENPKLRYLRHNVGDKVTLRSETHPPQHINESAALHDTT
jgi:hypothetical protein